MRRTCSSPAVNLGGKRREQAGEARAAPSPLAGGVTLSARAVL